MSAQVLACLRAGEGRQVAGLNRQASLLPATAAGTACSPPLDGLVKPHLMYHAEPHGNLQAATAALVVQMCILHCDVVQAQFSRGEYAKSLTLAVKAAQGKAMPPTALQAAVLRLAAHAALLCGYPAKALKYISRVVCIQPENHTARTMQRQCLLDMEYEARVKHMHQAALTTHATKQAAQLSDPTQIHNSMHTEHDRKPAAVDLPASSSCCQTDPSAAAADKACQAAVAEIVVIQRLLDQLITDDEERQEDTENLAAQLRHTRSSTSKKDVDSVAVLLNELKQVVSASVDAQIAFSLANGYTAVMAFFPAYPDQVEQLLICAGTCKLAGDGPLRVRWPQMVLQRLLGCVRCEPRLACRSLALLAYAAQDAHLRHSAFVAPPTWAIASGVQQPASAPVAACPTTVDDAKVAQQDQQLEHTADLPLPATPFLSAIKPPQLSAPQGLAAQCSPALLAQNSQALPAQGSQTAQSLVSQSSMASSIGSTSGRLSSIDSVALDDRRSCCANVQHNRQSSCLSEVGDVLQADPSGSVLLHTLVAGSTSTSLPANESVLASLVRHVQNLLQPAEGSVDSTASDLPLPMACLAAQLLYQYTQDTHSSQLLAALPDSNAISLLLGLYQALHPQMVSSSSSTPGQGHAWGSSSTGVIAQMLGSLHGTHQQAGLPCCAAAHLVLQSLLTVAQQQPSTLTAVAFTTKQLDSSKRAVVATSVHKSATGNKEKLTPTPLLASLLAATKQLAVSAPRCLQPEMGFDGHIRGYIAGKRAADPCAAHLTPSQNSNLSAACDRLSISSPRQQSQTVQGKSLLLRWLQVLCAVGVSSRAAARELYRAGVVDLLTSQIFPLFQGDQQLVAAAEKLLAVVALQCDTAMDELLEEGHVHGLIGVVQHLLPAARCKGKAAGSRVTDEGGQGMALTSKQSQRGLGLVMRALDKLSQLLDTCSGTCFAAVSRPDGILNLVHALACSMPASGSDSHASTQAPSAAAKPAIIKSPRWLTKSGPLPSVTACPRQVQLAGSVSEQADACANAQHINGARPAASKRTASTDGQTSGSTRSAATGDTKMISQRQSSACTSTQPAASRNTAAVLSPCVVSSALLPALRDAARSVFFACMDRARKTGGLRPEQVPAFGWYAQHRPRDLALLESQLRAEWAAALLPSPRSPSRHSSSGSTTAKVSDSGNEATNTSSCHLPDIKQQLVNATTPTGSTGCRPDAAITTRHTAAPVEGQGVTCTDDGARVGMLPDAQASADSSRTCSRNSTAVCTTISEVSGLPSAASRASLSTACSDDVAAATAVDQGTCSTPTTEQQQQQQMQAGSDDGYDSDGLKQVYASGPSREQKAARAAWNATGLADKMEWRQSADTLDIWMLLPPGTCKRDVTVSVTTTRLTISLSWAGRVLDGPLTRRVKAAEALWVIETDNQATRYSAAMAAVCSSNRGDSAAQCGHAALTKLHVVLPKQEARFWRSLFEGGPEKSHIEVLQEAIAVDEPLQSYDDLSEEAKQIVEEVRERQWMVSQGYFSLENSFDDFRLVLGDNLL